MTFITLLTFALVWTGLVWLSARYLGGETRSDWSAWWALHLLAAVLPVTGLFAASFLPAMPGGVTIAVPDDLSFLDAPVADGAGGEAAVMPLAGLLDVALVAIAALYLAVAAVLLTTFFIGRIRLALLVRRSCPVFVSDTDVPVLVCTEDISPFAFSGILVGGKPAIVLPARLLEEVGEDAIEPVIAHEAAHLTRRDTDLAFLFSLAAILLWPSPFIAMMVRRWRLSAELQCDRAALARADASTRKAYARTLLAALRLTKLSAENKKAGRALPCPPAAFSTSQLKDEKMRIANIMEGAASARKSPFAAAGLYMAVACLSIVGIGAAVTLGTGASAASGANATIVEGGQISSPYGMRSNPQDKARKQHHHGVDVKAPMGTPVRAPADGVIIDVSETYKDKETYGKVIVMQSAGGITTAFAHLGDFNVAKGDSVTRGQKIAEIGMSGQTTGPHVHIETYIDGEMVDPATVWSSLNK
ncbi:M23/M56 family metallopeptidase [Aquisalinus flavus]|uniref:Peptidase M23 domain-containing protein n=1 Tax=Aquisalinus flavus TaxID=1526572 RepID=A0A8J2V7J1_9PROT|nr:M23/M56 family metallopeptidase [Aquisalinus flavus]MBD0426328.1 peptidoglycan DD-metalloendopeptidase family protein [Aquisalinus flavus]UNE48106.1 peptidoglycan DD-metalloendopeptidase family protein [Aquisalinus flavus]GGD08847.1 hypothetical protein GCM10011342_17090 [Aquisalinus flavus]